MEECLLYAVEIRTSRWKPMARWYRDVLGLRSLIRIDEDQYALLSCGPSRIAILGRHDPGPLSGRISLSFEVADWGALHARLKKVGIASEPIGEIATDSEGLEQLSLTDPDGNRVRMFSWPHG